MAVGSWQWADSRTCDLKFEIQFLNPEPRTPNPNSNPNSNPEPNPEPPLLPLPGFGYNDAIMTPLQQTALLIPIGYLIGAIPFGLIVGWLKGIDVRKSGSGNIGATNVGRLLGQRYFWLVFWLDVIKGAIPVAVAGWLLYGDGEPTRAHYLMWLAVGAAVLLGNLFSIYIKFKGGKGVATSTGITLGIFPYFTMTALLGVAVFLVVLGIWRYISLASIVSAGAFPVIYILLGQWMGWDVFGTQLPLLIFAIGVAGLIIWRHRTNIARLRAGTENKIRPR